MMMPIMMVMVMMMVVMIMMMVKMMMIQMILDTGCNKMHKVPRSFNNGRGHVQRGTLAQVIFLGDNQKVSKKREIF